MSKIHLLSDQIINQIAAGEVIENPSSVVKELVENALDAHSLEIKVDIIGGGLQLIRVSDDGVGMSREEALLSLQRHATSKIKESEDLFSLLTMGFRGEALASIAAISKMTLTTALANEQGTRIEVEGGKIVDLSPYPRTRGTTIEVRSLFFNVPARKKFQKSAPLCAAEVTKVMTLLALSRPDIGFTLFKQSVEMFTTRPETKDPIQQRTKVLLGAAFCEGSYPITRERLQGMIGAPFKSRPNRSGQYLFINRRVVGSPLIAYAIKEGYGTRLSENRYPTFVLHLDVDPQLIDVNVHPQKREVRFQDEAAVKSQVREAICALFSHSTQEESVLPVTYSLPPWQPLSFCESSFVCQESPPVKKEVELSLPLFSYRSLAVIGTYFFVEEEGQLGVVDLLAARASLIFNTVQTKNIDKQGLLFPETFEVSLEEACHINMHLDFLERLGIAVRPVGVRSFMVEAIPTFMEEGQLGAIIVSLIAEIDKYKEGDLFIKGAGLLSSMSRRYKLKFLLQEAEALYIEVKKKISAMLCPDGKPIRVYLDDNEIAKFFSRRL